MNIISTLLLFCARYPRCLRVLATVGVLSIFTSPHSPWAQATPHVLAVYPSAESVPANILRFYIRFSEPMQEMGILRYVHLRDDTGQDLSGVFFENQYELWNSDRTEVTLLVDPGRVKTGLRAHEALGWAFTAGRTYTLEVSTGLKTFRDLLVNETYRKKFTVTAPDSTAPDPVHWDVQSPKAGTRRPLTVDFQESLDHISAQSLISVWHEGHPVAGKVVLLDHESRWQFKPAKDWEAGAYQIHVAKQLEDIAANSVLQVFDHSPDQYRNVTPGVVLPFDL